MSDHIPDIMVSTPRTDAVDRTPHPINAKVTYGNFARQLERELAAVTTERDELLRIADGFAANVGHMVERCTANDITTDAHIAWELGQWAVNLKAWAVEYKAIDAARGGWPHVVLTEAQLRHVGRGCNHE